MFANCCNPDLCAPAPFYLANYGGHRPEWRHALPCLCSPVDIFKGNAQKINDPLSANVLVHHQVFPDPEPGPDPCIDYFDPFSRIAKTIPKPEPELNVDIRKDPINACDVIRQVTMPDCEGRRVGHPYSRIMAGDTSVLACVNGKFPCNPRMPVLDNSIYKGCEPWRPIDREIPTWGRKLETNGCFYYNTYCKP